MAKPIERGTIVQVYDDPLTRTRPAFKANVRGCVNKDAGTYEGRTLRRYLVLPQGRGQACVEVSILDEESAS